MKTGWLIYEKKEAARNQGAVKLFEEAGERYGLDIELRYMEELEDYLAAGHPATCSQVKENSLPDFVINRTRDWKLGARFEQRGIRVFNTSEITRIGNDKYETYRIMEQLHVPVLPFCLGSNQQAQPDTQPLPDFPFVLKSCSGHGGKEVFWIASKEQYKEAVRTLKDRPFVVQKAASDTGKDVRLFVVDNQVRAEMLRTSSSDFRSNYSLGGQAGIWKPDAENRRIADQIVEKIFERFHLDYAGIDLIFHEGKPVFNELEDMVGARMLYQQTDVDIIGEFVLHIAREISQD